MPSIYPVPSTRVSTQLLHQRTLAQLHESQRSLLRIQQQLSTGQRLSVPSDDPASATRGLTLQRTIEFKGQVETNLNATESYINATDSSLASVSQLMADARGLAVRAADSTTSETERLAIAEQVRGIIRQLVDVGNERFRGRYLFAGSDTSQIPFEYVDGNVQYSGNDRDLRTLADVDFLVDSNVSGHEIFGGFSTVVKSDVDLNPVLRNETLLTDLHAGQGVRLGAVRVSDGTSSSVVDLSAAETIGDVARLLTDNPPAGRQLDVFVTSNGLRLELDAGNLTVGEVDGGTTAEQLGILSANGIGPGPLIGNDLDPVLKLTTRLEHVLGAPAAALVASAGPNNNVVIEALEPGTTQNDVSIQFVDDSLLRAAPGLNPGNEYAVYSTTSVAARAALTLTGPDNDLVLTSDVTGVAGNQIGIQIVASPLGGDSANVSYDAVARQFTIEIDDADQTTLNTLVTAINGSGVFTAAADGSLGEGFNGGAPVLAADAGVVQGNTGNSGGEGRTFFVHVSGRGSTSNDVVAALNADADFSAEFLARLDPIDSTTPALTGNGLVDPNALGVTGGGSGQPFDLDAGIHVQQGDQSHVIRFDDAETVEDLINAVHGSPASLVAEINESQTGLNLLSKLSGADFSIGENGGSTATHLGLRSFTTDTLLADLNHGLGVHTADGDDIIIQRNDGVQLGIDLTGAFTVGDVLDRINNHPSNLGPTTQVVAQLSAIGNGIELVDDNPAGLVLTVRRSAPSRAVWDLGLVPEGQDVGVPGDGPPPTAATAAISLTAPNNVNNSFVITANQFGTAYNGVSVNVVNLTASGDQAFVTYDSVGQTLTLDVDPTATTANTLIAAIGAEGTFQANLDLSTDTTNNGTGLIVDTGTVGVTAGGSSSSSAQPAATPVRFPIPNHLNTGFHVTALQTGTQWNGVEVELVDTFGAGDVAVANYDSLARRLTIDINQSGTTTNTIVGAIIAEGTFTASLDTSADPTNNGSGIPNANGIVGVTFGGAAETLTSRDVDPQEVEGVFNSLLRLERALRDYDLPEISRTVGLLDLDFDRANFGRGALGARAQGVEILQRRLADEDVEIRSALSDEIEVDLTQAISEMAARQASLQAALQTLAGNFSLTLLDFI